VLKLQRVARLMLSLTMVSGFILELAAQRYPSKNALPPYNLSLVLPKYSWFHRYQRSSFRAVT
jgi:hypothetical protein